jgi:hypothetical protein
VTHDDTLHASATNPDSVAPTNDHTIGYRGERPDRPERPEPSRSPAHEEVVIDDRAMLRPAQAVESKLARMLQEASLPVSHLQMRGLLRVR